MSTGGGNTTDDSINNRDLTTANECGESKYRNECRTKKHLERRMEVSSSPSALYWEQLFPGPAAWNERWGLLGFPFSVAYTYMDDKAAPREQLYGCQSISLTGGRLRRSKIREGSFLPKGILYCT